MSSNRVSGELVRRVWAQVEDLGVPQGRAAHQIQAAQRRLDVAEMVTPELRATLAQVGVQLPSSSKAPNNAPPLGMARPVRQLEEVPYAMYVRDVRHLQRQVNEAVAEGREAVRVLSAAIDRLANPRRLGRLRVRGAAVPVDELSPADATRLRALRAQVAEHRARLLPLEDLARLLGYLRGQERSNMLDAASASSAMGTLTSEVWTQLQALGVPQGGSARTMDRAWRRLNVDRKVTDRLRQLVQGSGTPALSPAQMRALPLESPRVFRAEVRAMERKVRRAVKELHTLLRAFQTQLARLAQRADAALGQGPMDNRESISAANAARIAELRSDVAQLEATLVPLEDLGRVLAYLRGRGPTDDLDVAKVREAMQKLTRETWAEIEALGLPQGGRPDAMNAAWRRVHLESGVTERLWQCVRGAQVESAATRPRFTEAEVQALKCEPSAKFRADVRAIHGRVGKAVLELRRHVQAHRAQIALLEHPSLARRGVGGLLGRVMSAPRQPSAADAARAQALRTELAQLEESLGLLQDLGHLLTYLRGKKRADGLDMVVQVGTSMPLAAGNMVPGYHGLRGVALGVGSVRLRMTPFDEGVGSHTVFPALNLNLLLSGALSPVENVPLGVDVMAMLRANAKPSAAGGVGGGMGYQVGLAIPYIGGVFAYLIRDDLDGVIIGLYVHGDPDGLTPFLGTGYVGLFKRPPSQGGARGVEFGMVPIMLPGFCIMAGHTDWKWVDPKMHGALSRLLSVLRKTKAPEKLVRQVALAVDDVKPDDTVSLSPREKAQLERRKKG